MSFLYILTKKNLNGQLEESRSKISSSGIVIGRGENVDIRLDDTRVSMLHASILLRENVLFVEDHQSFIGTRVNEQLISSVRLDDGDTISIGNSLFKVFFEDNVWCIHEFRESLVEDNEDEFIKEVSDRFSLKNVFPSMLLLSVFATFLILLLYYIYPSLSGNRESWMTGSASNPHRTFINDCSTCHQIPFKRVQNDACLSCHAISDHSNDIGSFFKSHADLNVSCGTCHHEHNATDGLIIHESRLCISCHASLAELYPDRKTLNVSSLSLHPQFRITHLDENFEILRSSLDNKNKIVDSNSLKLNHQLHLKNDLNGKDGSVTLDCNSCHQLSDNKKSFTPITYEKDCKSCHALTFSMDKKETAVPHASADEVYSFLRYFYADLHLEKKVTGQEDFAERVLPGKQKMKKTDENLEFTRSKVIAESRKTEKELFNKTACVVCHDVKEKSLDTEESIEESYYEIRKVQTPKTWIPSAEFNHLTHQYVSCQSCHDSVAHSEKTSDVLIPGVENCTLCHHDSGKDSSGENKIKSDCSMCHPYHFKELLPDNRKKEIR